MEFEYPHLAAASPSGLLATRQWITEDRPHPRVGLGTVTARCGQSRSCRPCHPRAISSGHQRSITVTQTAPFSCTTAPDLGIRNTEKVHGMQGVSHFGPAQLPCH